MGIRGRLVALVIGATVPLALLGLWGIRREWLASRGHLDELVVQQAELASVAFERWVDAQQQPLVTIAAIVEQSPDTAQLQESLRLTITPRPEWVDVRVLNAAGEVVASEPRRAAPLSPSLKEKLTGGLKSHRTPIVETDWTNVSGQAVIAIGVPVKGEGAVIGRINAAAMNGLFDGVRLDGEAVLAVHDEGQRIVYRRPEAKEYAGVDVGGSALFAALGPNRTAEIEVASPVDGVKRIYGLARAGTTHYTTVVGVPSAVLYGAAWRQLVFYLSFGLLTLMCVGVAALWIAGGIALPLSHLNRVAHRFGAGDLSIRAEQGGGGEIGELGETFNTIAARIKEREERLTELNRLKSEFVSGVSHELRTPLTTIKMLTRVMLRGVESEAERRKYLETIGAQCDRQIDLVLNLLDLSRIESNALNLEREPIAVGALIRSCVKSESAAAELRGHSLRAETSAGLPYVAGDRGALRRVVCSLIENAVKYTPDGGHITVAGRAAPGQVEISVTDTGRGIAPADLPRIFEKFYRGQTLAGRNADQKGVEMNDDSFEQVEVPGVGLGLYLANNIVKQMGGIIRVESEPNRGSAFTVELPVWRATVLQAKEVSDGEAAAFGG